MTEEMMLSLNVVAGLIFVAILLFGLISYYLREKLEHSKFLKIIFGGFYWGIFIFLLNLPMTSHETYHLTPFESGDYIQVTLPSEENYETIITFHYEKNGVIHDDGVHLFESEYSSAVNSYEDGTIASIQVGKLDGLDYKFNDEGSNSLVIEKSGSLIQKTLGCSKESWSVSVSKNDVEMIAKALNLETTK